MNFARPLAPSVFFRAWLMFGCLAAVVFASRAHAQPPAWPDAHYLTNGCYVSTERYLAKLREHYPDVLARAENVRVSNGKLHTIAVVRWGDKTYLRDMFLGVAFARGDVQRGFDDAVAQWLRKGGRHGHSELIDFTSDRRWNDVQTAAQWLGALHPEIIQVSSARGVIPVLWWTTANGELALFEPSTGTAVGHTRRTPLAVATELFGGGTNARMARVAHLKVAATTAEASN